MGYVPQDLSLFPSLSVRDHLAFALDLRRWDREATMRRVGELSDMLGLSRLLDRRPHGLSGGEETVAIGGALLSAARAVVG